MVELLSCHVIDRALDGTRWQVIVWVSLADFWVSLADFWVSFADFWVSFADFWVSFADFWVSFADFWACERVLERIVGWVLGRTVGAGKGLELCVVHPLTPWADRREGP